MVNLAELIIAIIITLAGLSRAAWPNSKVIIQHNYTIQNILANSHKDIGSRPNAVNPRTAHNFSTPPNPT